MGRLADARRRARRGAPAPPPAGAPQPESSTPAPEGAAALAEQTRAATVDEPALPVDRTASAESVPAETPPVAVTAGEDGVEAVEVEASLATVAEAALAADSQPEPASSSAPAEGDAGASPAFPDDDARPQARYVLPSSGLADEILAAAEPGGAAAGETGLVELAPAAEAAPPAARAHQFTFFATPEREAREQVEATEHLVTFLVGGEEYGVDVRLVQEIIRVPAVTAVPRAPAFVRGVVNLRGRIIPVIDLKTKLGLGRVEAAQRAARVVVVRLKGRLVGLLVDGASQVLKVPVSVIEAAPEEVVEVESHFLRGVAKLGGRLIILVDLLEVLAPELRADGAAP